MRTYKLHRDDGHFLAFEIENTYIRPKKIAKLLSDVDDISDVRVREPFSSSSDVHLRFQYLGSEFIVWEPYGDSSRYWIGPENADDPPKVDIAPLEKALREYKPPVFIKVLGDLITLNFKSLFQKPA